MVLPQQREQPGDERDRAGRGGARCPLLITVQVGSKRLADRVPGRHYGILLTHFAKRTFCKA
jgi:hypothetical protein